MKAKYITCKIYFRLSKFRKKHFWFHFVYKGHEQHHCNVEDVNKLAGC
jgi:hypothetical protein